MESRIDQQPGVRRGHTLARDAVDAVREFHAAVAQDDMVLVVFFCSSSYDIDRLEGGGVEDHVIRRHHQQDGIVTFVRRSLRGQCRQGQCGLTATVTRFAFVALLHEAVFSL